MSDMTRDDALFTAEEEERGPGRRLHRAFWSLTSGFWRGPTAMQAWVFTLLILALIGANIGIQYGINRWNRTFFDALDARDTARVSAEVLVFAGLAVAAVTAMVAQVFCRLSLQARWRRWLTARLAGAWLADRRFYQMSIAAPDIDSPEFRMTDDVRFATEPLVDFAIGLSNALLMAAVFVGVLWTAGGSITVFGWTIPGYFVVCAAAYAVLTSGAMVFLGRPLIRYTGDKNAAEAKIRFELVRVRENAESIALIGGEEDERKGLNQTLDEVLARWRHVVAQQARMTFIIHGNTVLAPVIPLLLGAPKFLSGEMSLGQLMQIAAAFVQVQIAFNWLVENYIRFAEWEASATRVVALWQTFTDLEAAGRASDRIVVEEGPDDALRLRDLSVAQHNGRVVVNGAEAVFQPGEKVLLRGESGSGKSTLIRAVAGLWPWGSGHVLLPRGAAVMFVPQKPYVPNGSLRAALVYPGLRDDVPDQDCLDALHRCGLRHLGTRLDDVDRWDKVLSGGEQQRLAFARLLIQRPAVVIMDEATSALDEASQDSMMSLFRDELSEAMVLSVGHRPGLEEYHDRTIELSRRPKGAVITHDDGEAPKARRSSLIGKVLRRALRPRPTPDHAGEEQVLRS
jgi:putative ATP-binding cassette transporter